MDSVRLCGCGYDPSPFKRGALKNKYSKIPRSAEVVLPRARNCESLYIYCTINSGCDKFGVRCDKFGVLLRQIRCPLRQSLVCNETEYFRDCWRITFKGDVKRLRIWHKGKKKGLKDTTILKRILKTIICLNINKR